MTTSNSHDHTDNRPSILRSRKWCVQLGLIPAASTVNSLQQQQQQRDDNTYQQQQQIDDMCRQYQNLVDQFPFPADECWQPHGRDDNGHNKDEKHETTAAAVAATNSSSSDTSNDATTTFLDPLTAMVMEQESRTERLQKLDLKYRKEKALRNRGKAMERTVLEEEGVDPRVERAVTLQIIDKDLARLPPPPPPPPAPTSTSGVSSSPTSSASEHEDISKKRRTRKAILRRVLYCLHCATHATPGYRQGMHEIASYLLHALEVEQEATKSNATNNKGGSGDDDEDDEDDDATATLLGAQVYSMLHAILMAILPAYDVTSQNQPSHNTTTSNTSPTTEQQQHQGVGVHDMRKPLEGVSRRILAQVAIHDAVLCRRLQVDLQVPAQLYLTKWIRLLYSREVASSQVLCFWDELFELMKTTSTISLMSVLETVAAARLLLWRGRLHLPPPSPSGQQHDDHDTLHLLMNLPMETVQSTREWLQLSRQMIHYNQSRQALWSTCVKDQPTLPTVTLPPPTAVPGVVLLHSSPPVPSSSTTATLTMNNSKNTATSTFTSARMNLPTPVFGAAAANNNNISSNQIMDRFSFSSVRQNLEQTVKSTTQSIGQRLHQEWENLAGDLGGVDGGGGVSSSSTGAVPLPLRSSSSNSRVTGATDAYNITYRNDSMTLLDPPVPPAARATGAITPNNNNIQLQQQHAAWARQLQVQTATLQSFFIQIEQEHERNHGSNMDQNHNRVPPIVWEALATLESMRREILSSSSSSTTPSP